MSLSHGPNLLHLEVTASFYQEVDCFDSLFYIKCGLLDPSMFFSGLFQTCLEEFDLARLCELVVHLVGGLIGNL